jgi:hypothetical protein
MVIAPVAAYACDNLTSCEEEPQPEEDPGDGGGDPGDGGGEIGGGGISVISLPAVEIIGHRDPAPGPPDIPIADPASSVTVGGGNGGADTPILYHPGKKEDKKTECLRNNGESTISEKTTFTYTVSTQVSTNLSASLMAQLTAAIGTQLNTTTTVTREIGISLAPGQTITLAVEYQTNVWAIPIDGGWELVNVTAPTGTVTAQAC